MGSQQVSALPSRSKIAEKALLIILCEITCCLKRRPVAQRIIHRAISPCLDCNLAAPLPAAARTGGGKSFGSCYVLPIGSLPFPGFPRLPASGANSVGRCASQSVFAVFYLCLNDRPMPSVDFSGVIQGVQSFFPVVFLVKPAPGRGVFWLCSAKCSSKCSAINNINIFIFMLYF